MLRTLALAACAALCAASATPFPSASPLAFAAGPALPRTARAAAATQLKMGRVCDLTAKSANRKARVVTFSHKRNKTVQHVNLQKKRLFWEEGNRFVTMRISTKALRTIEKYGLQTAAGKYGIDLRKF